MEATGVLKATLIRHCKWREVSTTIICDASQLFNFRNFFTCRIAHWACILLHTCPCNEFHLAALSLRTHVFIPRLCFPLKPRRLSADRMSLTLTFATLVTHSASILPLANSGKVPVGSPLNTAVGNCLSPFCPLELTCNS